MPRDEGDKIFPQPLPRTIGEWRELLRNIGCEVLSDHATMTTAGLAFYILLAIVVVVLLPAARSLFAIDVLYLPLLVIVSWFVGQPMNLIFSDPLELFAIAGAAFIVNAVAGDAETTWFEGLLLVGVYALFGLAFLFR